MERLEDKIDEVTFEDYVMQYNDFKDDFTPKILKEMEDREYMLEVCVIGLSTIVQAMINNFGNDELKNEVIKIIESETLKTQEIESDEN